MESRKSKEKNVLKKERRVISKDLNDLFGTIKTNKDVIKLKEGNPLAGCKVPSHIVKARNEFLEKYCIGKSLFPPPNMLMGTYLNKINESFDNEKERYTHNLIEDKLINNSLGQSSRRKKTFY